MSIAEFQLSEEDIKECAELAIREARRQGADQVEVGASLDSGLELTVRLGEVETLERSRDRGLGVTVYFGKRKGSASTADLGADAIRETVTAACTIARYTAEDQHAGLAPAELMAANIPDLDLWHPWTFSLDEAIRKALACEAAARAVDARIDNSDGATLASHGGMRVYANSHGFIGAYRGTSHSLSCTVLARENGGMQRDYWYSAARDPGELETPEAIGRKAGERAIRRLGAKRISTRRAPVLLVPEMAKSLAGHFIGAIRGTAQYRRTSFLVDAAGETVFPEFMQIVEQPQLPKAMGSAPFDDEGVATRERALIKDGVLQGYVLNSYSARRLGLQTTGNAGGVRNISVQPGDENLEQLCRRMQHGLLVTELMGQGVNGVTGDYSRGAAGFWIEDGAIAWPVEEITIAGNLRDMFAGIVAVGNDVDMRGNIRTGSILLDEMTIAGE
ncbi:MAG TPA: metalloprotease PmbA [Gammaproteobacteria bacterium]